MHVVIAESPSPKPYNAMATLSFKQFLWRAPRTILKELPKPYYAWLIAIFIGSQSMLSQTASAEDAKGSAAQAALMPWQLLGLDGEFPVRHRQLLSELRELAKNIWLSQAVSLDQQAANQGVPLSLNQKLLSQSIQVGRSRAKLQTPHYLQPIICPIGNQLLFALELIASDSQHVLAVQQTLVPRAAWENFAAHPQPPISPAAAWQTAANNLLQTTEQPKHDVRRNPFKLRLGLMRGSQDSRTGAHLCLNLLLTQALLSRFTVLSAIGDLEATHLRRVLGIHDPLLRTTRELVLDWGMQSKGPHFEIEGRWSEAVRASSIDSHIKLKANLDTQLAKLSLPDDFLQLLQKESDALKFDELPQVSHIYGAYAYLDRGRAWGLDINDRLYLNDGQRKIKGHVVGFFGTGAGLKTPAGDAIHEGAIVYIRKDQRKVKIGDRLEFDPTRFPTPWPPVAQPAPTGGP